MGAFSDGFVKWVRGMKKARNAKDAAERAAADQIITEGFNEMVAAPIRDRSDQFASDILDAFDK